MWKDSLRYPEIAITSSMTAPLPNTAEDAGLAQGEPYRGVGGEDLAL